MKKRLKLHLKMYLLLTLVYIGVALVSMGLLYLFTPTRYFGVFPVIDVFYWLCGMGMTFFLDRSRRRHKSADKLLNVFMISRGVKFLLTIVLLVVGVKVLELHRLTFVISLMCNYFIYSGLELYIYHRYNKRVTTGKWD